MMDYKSMIERSVATAAQAFLAVFVVTDLGTLDSALTAAAAAGLAVVKSFAASKVGDKGTASFV
jgi:hypothetical protein